MVFVDDAGLCWSIYMYLSSRAATYESRESCWIDSVRRACFETGTVKSRGGELVCRKLWSFRLLQTRPIAEPYGISERSRGSLQETSPEPPSCIDAGLQYSTSSAWSSTHTRLSVTKSSMTATARARSQSKFACSIETVTKPII